MEMRKKREAFGKKKKSGEKSQMIAESAKTCGKKRH